MQLIVFLIVYPILWIISILPFPILYLFSDLIYVLIYHIVGYRKKVVRNNLKLAFPKKTDKELKQIEKKFYKHLADMFLEMIKTLSISNAAAEKRYKFTNVELLQQLTKEKSVIINTSHYASWEWVFVLNNFVTDTKGYGVYAVIENKYFDKLVRDIRQKYGTTLITTSDTAKTIFKNKSENIKACYGFVSDQSPMVQKTLHWNEFMGIKVPIHVGAESLAKKADIAMVYMRVKKVGRGYYEATFEMLAKKPNDFENYEISDLYMKKIEEQLHEEPAYYFWTHRRWKHRDKAPK